jgi:hypothetical protein
MNTKLQGRRLVAHSILTLLGMAAIPVLFLPFAYDVSPVAAIFDKDLWRLALPFFLAPFAVAASIRWIVSGSFSRLERVIAYVVSAAVAPTTLSVYLKEDWPSGPQGWLIWVVPPAVLLLGACLLIRNSRMGPCREFNPVLAIQMAHVANGLFCVIALYDTLQVGGYFTLVAASTFMLQTILVAAIRPDRGIELQAV